MILSRRTLLKVSSLAPLVRLVGMGVAHAQERQFRHATSLLGDVKYPLDFKRFDYVNPDAPKGGHVRLYAIGSFDSLNTNTFKGEPTSYGGIATEALMTPSLDEASTEYGLIAGGIRYPQDFSRAVFRLRAEAKFHDGTAVTPEDVVWSMAMLKEVNPSSAFYYKNVEKGDVTGDGEVTFVFSEKGNRELPHIVGQLFVLSKAWWTGKDASGRTRNIAETTLEPSLGSGAYKVHEVKPGTSITVKRFPDYWGEELPVNVGQDNFEEIELIYFRDANVALEAFKGDQYDFRVESSAKNWATGYDTPAVKQGRIVKEELSTKNPDGMQCWAFNTRRAKFQDARVRHAFNYVFDFEWSNANLFYGQYTRSTSYFNNSELAATGLPSPEELAILDEVRDRIPPEVFTAEYKNPVNSSPQDRRRNLREASKLLAAAGWKVTQAGGRNSLKNASGETLAVEFLIGDPLFERIALPYQQQLELLGIAVRIRTVDSAQYERQLQTFDFDIIVNTWGQSLSPGNEQRDFWGSASADRNGSRNYLGIKDPAIDRLIERLIFAANRADLIAATRALDRALLWNHFVVPMWYAPYDRVARWDRFGRPGKQPDYSIGFPSTWWWDEEKARKVKG